MNEDPAKLSLSNFLAGESRDPLQAPPSFTAWMQAGAWAVELYEPELLASADARTSIRYDGKSQPVINLCSYNYLGLANHPEVIAAAHEALKTHGLGACGAPILSGMTDLHRELERRDAKFLGREDAMLFNSGFGGALGTISGLLRNLEWEIAFRLFMERFRKRSARWEDLWRDRVRRSNIYAFMRILTFILVRCRRSSSRRRSKRLKSACANLNSARSFGKTPITFMRDSVASVSIPAARQPTSCPSSLANANACIGWAMNCDSAVCGWLR